MVMGKALILSACEHHSPKWLLGKKRMIEARKYPIEGVLSDFEYHHSGRLENIATALPQ